MFDVGVSIGLGYRELNSLGQCEEVHLSESAERPVSEGQKWLGLAEGDGHGLLLESWFCLCC
jgi:hypothetical protein